MTKKRTAAQDDARVRSALRSAAQTYTACRLAFDDFQAADDDVERRLAALRNFVSNGFSVSQMVHRLKTVPTTAEAYAEWYPPIQARLAGDVDARYFWELRTAVTHEEMPEVGTASEFLVTEEAVGFKLVHRRVGSTSQVVTSVIGVKADGTEVYYPQITTPFPIIGDDPAIVPRMAAYLGLLHEIVVSAHETFGPAASEPQTGVTAQ